MEKIRETLLTFRLQSTELLSFWRDFFSISKFQFFMEMCEKKKAKVG